MHWLIHHQHFHKSSWQGDFWKCWWWNKIVNFQLFLVSKLYWWFLMRDMRFLSCSYVAKLEFSWVLQIKVSIKIFIWWRCLCKTKLRRRIPCPFCVLTVTSVMCIKVFVMTHSVQSCIDDLKICVCVQMHGSWEHIFGISCLKVDIPEWYMEH